jgi:hypothetical protein
MPMPFLLFPRTKGFTSLKLPTLRRQLPHSRLLDNFAGFGRTQGSNLGFVHNPAHLTQTRTVRKVKTAMQAIEACHAHRCGTKRKNPTANR